MMHPIHTGIHPAFHAMVHMGIHPMLAQHLASHPSVNMWNPHLGLPPSDPGMGMQHPQDIQNALRAMALHHLMSGGGSGMGDMGIGPNPLSNGPQLSDLLQGPSGAGINLGQY